MKMRKWLTGLIVIAILAASMVSTVGCTSAKKTDVVFLYMGPVEFFTGLSNGFKTTFEEQGYTYESAEANFNAATQNDQIDNYITKGVKMLIITAVDANAVKDSAKRAKDAGIKVLAFTVDLGAANQTFYMGSNETEMGNVVAQVGKEWADYKTGTYTADDILVIGNNSNDASKQRTNAIVAKAEALFGVTLGANSKKLDWSKETAVVQASFETYWTGSTKKPKIILCYNSEMALGVNAYLTTTGVVANKEDYCVAGADAGAIIGEMNKPIDATTIRGIASLSGAAEIVLEVKDFGTKLLKGESMPASNLSVPFMMTGKWKV